MGKALEVRFLGELRDNQEAAAKAVLKHDCGILSASTAFGKTVVCSRLIAERKVSTLILLESSALIEQWQKALEEVKTPLILTRFTDQAAVLYELLKPYADKPFLLTGEMPKKERDGVMKAMAEVQSEETMLLVATGQLVGEGFDYPRLDALFLATPVSWKGVVEQYAGRLHRDYPGKEAVYIYDYVDTHIPVFDKMYAKRLRTYCCYT